MLSAGIDVCYVPLADILVQHIGDAQSLLSGSAVYLIGGGGLSCNGTEREGASRVEPSNTAMLSSLKVFAGATVFSTKAPRRSFRRRQIPRAQ